MNQKFTGKIPKLDFLRFVSAALVVLYHAGVPGAPAGLGVLTFFVISGFLITHLLVSENERAGDISLRSFYVRRSLRIFPAFYMYWMIAVADMVLRHRIVWTQAVCSFFYVNNYYQGLHGYPYSLLAHTWSLGVEEQFYLVWPGLFVLFRNSLPTLQRILLFAIPCFWIYRLILAVIGVSDAYLYTALETRIDAILVGCLLALVWHTNSAAALIAEVQRVRYMPIILGLLAGSQIMQVFVGNNYKYIIGYAIDPVLIAAFIAQMVTMKSGAWMDSAPLSYLGRISYSTYLYQQIVLPAFKHLHLPFALSVPGSLLAVWAVAAISFEIIERPFLKLKRHESKQRKSVPELDVSNASETLSNA